MGEGGLLDDVRVLELSATEPGLPGEAVAGAGRILADLGAHVVAVAAWADVAGEVRALTRHAGKRLVDPEVADVTGLAAAADVVLEAVVPDRGPLPDVAGVHVLVTPYGATGPHARWRGSDLSIVAASGNLFLTGDPDRPPLRASEPAAYAHGAPEIALAALTALASGRSQQVDVSLQEVLQAANMGGASRFPRTADRGARRGPDIGRTREVWPCADGYVIFGMRGGPARARNWEILEEQLATDGFDVRAFAGRDWAAFDHAAATQEELDALAEPLAAWFAQHTMAQLYDLATRTNLMLAPAADAAAITSNPQFVARGLIAPVAGVGRIPWTFVTARSARDDLAEAPGARGGPEPAAAAPWPARDDPAADDADQQGDRDGGRAWSGLRLLEFGSGAAGPLITRPFIEHGATCVRIESTARPDFLRLYYSTPGVPRLEGSPMFTVLNAGKRSVTLNLKDERGVELARRLVDACDAVVENFAPRTMARWGLDYDTLAADRPDLVMVSSCLYGNTGPHRNYPGFGSQGAALSGWTHLTGWPDRAPVGPFGTITDSLAPRYAAAALAAALRYRRRTGRGVYLDVSQVEAAIHALGPWIAEHTSSGAAHGPLGNRHPHAVPHGVFPAAGDDRWIALAAWTDAEWRTLAGALDIDATGLDTLENRLAAIDDVERGVARATRDHDAHALARRLQADGLDAHAVLDLGALHADPQLDARGHLVALEHPLLGPQLHERSGFRLAATPGAVDAPGPTLGQHTREVLRALLDLGENELDDLQAGGVLS